MNFYDAALEIGGVITASTLLGVLGTELFKRYQSDWKQLNSQAKRPKPFSTIKARLDAMNDIQPE